MQAQSLPKVCRRRAQHEAPRRVGIHQRGTDQRDVTVLLHREEIQHSAKDLLSKVLECQRWAVEELCYVDCAHLLDRHNFGYSPLGLHRAVCKRHAGVSSVTTRRMVTVGG
jgi:hypothetical protein